MKKIQYLRVFFPSYRKKEIDSTYISIETYRNFFEEEAFFSSSEKEVLKNRLNSLKFETKLVSYKIINIGSYNKERYVLFFDANQSFNYESFYFYKGVPLRIKLIDFSRKKDIKIDFYRLLNSVRIRILSVMDKN